jgi:hypothetical protein
VSNNVLEFEERRVSAEIEAQSKRKATVPEELTDRKQQLEIKMQLLVLQVQTGKLTMESRTFNLFPNAFIYTTFNSVSGASSTVDCRD